MKNKIKHVLIIEAFEKKKYVKMLVVIGYFGKLLFIKNPFSISLTFFNI
jgi:hypothetical protein